MFSKDTVIKTCDGRTEEIGRLATSFEAGVGLIVSTKTGAGPFVSTSLGEGTAEITALITAPGEYMELVTSSGRRVKCAPKTKLCLAGGGFAYAEESNQAIVETDQGPETIVHSIRNGNQGELVSIRLNTVHAVNASGIWFLVD